MKKNILVASDSKNFFSIMEAMFTGKYTTQYAETEEDALKAIEKTPVNLILVTPRLKNSESFKFLEKLRASNLPSKDAPIFFMTGVINPATIQNSHKYSVSDIVKLPFEPLEFDDRVNETIIKFSPARERPDPVTGLLKKALAEDKISEMLASGKKGALMLVDLDHYSFASSKISDKTMITCRNIIQEEIDEKAVLAVDKSGGFIIFIPDLREREKVEEYAKRLIAKILERVVNEKVYISIGLAVSDRHGKIYEDLYQTCDRGLGEARTQGKNTACFFMW